MATLTVSADLKLTSDVPYIGVQGESSIVLVEVASSLVKEGCYAQVHFQLPDGSYREYGQYDYSAGWFVFQINSSDPPFAAILEKAGRVLVQFQIHEVLAVTRLLPDGTPYVTVVKRPKMVSSVLEMQVYRSIMASSGNNTEPIPPDPPVTDFFVYAATADQFSDARLYRIRIPSMDIENYLSVPSTLYSLVNDGTNLYAEGQSDRYLAKYSLAPTNDLEVDLGVNMHIRTLCEHGDYIYVSAEDGVNIFLLKYLKSDLSNVGSLVVSDVVFKIVGYGDYLYTFETDGVRKRNLDLSLSLSHDITLAASVMFVAEGYIYLAGVLGISGKIYKLLASTLATELTLDTGIGIYARSLLYAAGYLYVVGSDRKMYKYDPLDLSVVASSPVSSGTLYAIGYHDGFVYTGSALLDNVVQYDVETMTNTDGSEGLPDAIWAIAGDKYTDPA